jgi:hypothetical protein
MDYLDQPVTIVAAMWNHASRMEQKMDKMALDWPRLTGGEMADLVTFIQTSAQSRR